MSDDTNGHDDEHDKGEQLYDVREPLTPIGRLNRDLRNASRLLSQDEVRFMVYYYYATQKDRIRAAHQLRALTEAGEPASVLSWVSEQAAALERAIKVSLDVYSTNHPVGAWAREQKGIGPVIAAGLLAHIDIHKAQTIGSIWRFAGLDPTTKWKKGQKRPWNADLKRLCFLIGESFVKVSGREDAYYGHVYAARKAWETERNERGEYADQARAALEEKNYGKTTEAYKAYAAGKLPKARIHLRAARYAVKLFLAHMWAIWYEHEFKRPPPNPWPIEYLEDHRHFIPPPVGGKGPIPKSLERYHPQA